MLNNVAMLWSAFTLFLLCQPVSSCIEPFLHGLDFSVPPIPALVSVSKVIPLILTGIGITKISPISFIDL